MEVPQLPLLLLLLCLGAAHLAGAFYNMGDDVNMDFMTNDSNAKADVNKMMLMNTDDPKLRTEAEEAFKEIMRAKRLTKLQECRRTCVVDHEEAAEFRQCNDKCEAEHQPGEYSELPTLQGEMEQPLDADKPEAKQQDDSATGGDKQKAESKRKEEEKQDEEKTKPKEEANHGSGEL